MGYIACCSGCGMSVQTLAFGDSERVCVRCLRTYFVGAELQRILELDARGQQLPIQDTTASGGSHG